MTYLNHAQRIRVHNLSLEAQLARTEQELVDLVLIQVPEALGIDDALWFARSNTDCFNRETELMIRLLRQHLAAAFLRVREADAERKRRDLSLPALNQDSLTRREREALPHLLNGKSNSEIASILGISPRTAEKHVASLIEKSGAENRKTLISQARLASTRSVKYPPETQ